MGLPIHRIVIASNANNVLTEWIQTGCYDLSKRTLVTTTSPAIADLFERPVAHPTVVNKDEIEGEILKFLDSPA